MQRQTLTGGHHRAVFDRANAGASFDSAWETSSTALYLEDEVDSDEDETLQVLSVLFPTARGRSRASRRKPLPRIVQQDIRRHYPQMLFNALNSHDSNMINAFMQRYANPAATMEKTLDGASMSTCTALPIESPTVRVVVNGSSAISKYWAAMNSIIPDHCVRLRDVNIVRRVRTVTDAASGRTQLVCDPAATQIVCDFEGHSTHMFEVSPPSYAYAALGRNFVIAGDAIDVYDDPAHSDDAWSTGSADDDADGPAKRPRLSSSFGTDRRPRPFPVALPLVRRRRLLDVKLCGQLVIDLDGSSRLSKFLYRSISIDTAEL